MTITPPCLRQPARAGRIGRVCALLFLGAAGAIGTGQAADTNRSSGLDLPSFRIIAERNIFNPNRSGGSREVRPRETRREPKVDTIALVGTMIYDKGYFAFFDGSSSDYRKQLGPGETIAGYTLKTIEVGGVQLEADGKVTELKVNEQLRREDDGPWQVSEQSTSFARASGPDRSREGDRGRSWDRGRGSDRGRDSGSRSSRSSGGGSSASSSGELSDVLKRLMEEREKAMK